MGTAVVRIVSQLGRCRLVFLATKKRQADGRQSKTTRRSLFWQQKCPAGASQEVGFHFIVVAVRDGNPEIYSRAPSPSVGCHAIRGKSFAYCDLDLVIYGSASPWRRLPGRQPSQPETQFRCCRPIRPGRWSFDCFRLAHQSTAHPDRQTGTRGSS